MTATVADRGAVAGRTYLERGEPVRVVIGWRGPGPRNVLVERADGTWTTLDAGEVHLES